MGTLVNALAVILGGVIGLLVRKGIKESWQYGINKALGVSVFVIGINGVISNMFISEGGSLSASGELLLVVSLVIGTLIGEIVGIDSALERLSLAIEKKFPVAGFAAGFMNATVLFCVGAMAIVGSISDGLTGNATTLYIKSTLDFTSAIILSSALGAGVIFSALPILLYQGAITLFAGALESIIAGELLRQICAVGYAIIICIGMNFLSSEKIKTANMLPSILVPIVYSYIVKITEILR
ncbi:MAG: DUF554 domain-containing protein [Eubacteriaceae bacterium]|nr:DUF554 domain-containing protein [Eubacteriaceae bacterium]